MIEIIKLINGTKRFFISNKGYCYKESKNGFKKQKININLIKGVPRVCIQNERKNLVLLMIEHFYKSDLEKDFTYTWKIIEGNVPYDKITIVNHKLNTNDSRLIKQFRCDRKSYSSNARVEHKQKVTPEDVLNVLKRNDFKCFYCGEKLKSKTWHLDHVYPISLGGHNIVTNLTASCKCCNTMKGALTISQFYDKIKKIHKNIIL